MERSFLAYGKQILIGKYTNLENLKFLNDQTIYNIDINPVEELFFFHFHLKKQKNTAKKIVFNQGDILNYMNIHASINVSKYDIKDIFVKNKLNYTPHRTSEGVKEFCYLKYRLMSKIKMKYIFNYL